MRTTQFGLGERLCPPCSSSLSLNSAAGEPDRDREAADRAGDGERDLERDRDRSRSFSLLLSRWLSRLLSLRLLRSRRLGERDFDLEWDRRRRRLKERKTFNCLVTMNYTNTGNLEIRPKTLRTWKEIPLPPYFYYHYNSYRTTFRTTYVDQPLNLYTEGVDMPPARPRATKSNCSHMSTQNCKM